MNTKNTVQAVMMTTPIFSRRLGRKYFCNTERGWWLTHVHVSAQNTVILQGNTTIYTQRAHIRNKILGTSHIKSLLIVPNMYMLCLCVYSMHVHESVCACVCMWNANAVSEISASALRRIKTYMGQCPAKPPLWYFFKFFRTSKRKVTLTLKCMANYKFSAL